MKDKVLMGAAIAVVLVIIAAFALGAFGAPGDGSTQATATVYIQSADGGDVYKAEIDLGQPSTAEAMMLAFDQGIRSVQFVPLQYDQGTNTGGGGGDTTGTPPTPVNAASIFKHGLYKIWAKVTFSVAGTNLKSVDKAVIEFYGDAGMFTSSGTPDHATSYDSIYSSSAGGVKVTNTLTSIQLNTAISSDNSAKPFDKVSSGTTLTALTGDAVDGTVLNLKITVHGTDLGGGPVSAMTTASIKFSVPSYLVGSLSVSVTSLTGSTA